MPWYIIKKIKIKIISILSIKKIILGKEVKFKVFIWLIINITRINKIIKVFIIDNISKFILFLERYWIYTVYLIKNYKKGTYFIL